MSTTGRVLALILAAGTAAAASIRNSPHDMASGSTTTTPKSVTGAAGTDQTCVFCHTPHRPLVNVPLWNHTATTQTFTFYASYYTNSYLGLAQPTNAMLSGTKTKVCLSCHDGVTAVGSVYNLNGSAGATITMTAALGANANLGINLADDHPLLYPVDTTKDLEIRLPASGDPVKLYDPVTKRPQAPPANGGVVECTSCHNPHDNGQNAYGKFLVKSNTNAGICTTCHVKTGFAGSIHASSPTAYTPPPGGGAAYPATTVGEWACRACHRMHGAGGTGAYLNRGVAAGAGANPEENTCFQCHGNPPLTAGTKNIQTLLGYASHHPTVTVFGIHRDPEQSGTEYSVTPNRRHAECTDCHDPHGVQAGNRLAKPIPNNLLTNVLLYGWGALPTYGASAWTPPTSYTRQVFTNTAGYYEYELCLKCHSSYAYGGTPPAGYTDQSIEFNPANTSHHPVLTAGNNNYCTPTATNGNHITMLPPWNQTAGRHDTMFCSDCHGSDVGTDPEGPHGSAQASLLQASLVATIPAGYSNYATPLCIKCHAPAVYANTQGTTGTTGITLGSRYQHQANGGMSRAPGATGSGIYGGCLVCHGNLTAGVKGTFHGEYGSWAAGPKNQFLCNTTNFTNYDEVNKTCYAFNCHNHSAGQGY